MRLFTLVARRLGAGVLLVIGASVVLFALVDLAPGDPVLARFGFQAASLTEADLARLREQYGLDDPLPERYARFVADVAHGDLGTSARSGTPVRTLLTQTFPVTVSLTVVAALTAAAMALLLGTIAAPVFWLGLLAIDLFAIRLGWLPPGGYVPLSEGLWPWLRSLLMPGITLGLGVGGILTRVVRA